MLFFDRLTFVSMQEAKYLQLPGEQIQVTTDSRQTTEL